MANQDIVKGLSMIVMFLLTMIVGNIPLRLKSFKENQLVLSLASAFSGGLFLSVGLIHLIPEAIEHFETYFEQVDSSSEVEVVESEGTTSEKAEKEHFPYSMLIAVLSFSFVLMIEKVLSSHSDFHVHSHGDEHNHNHKENHKHDEHHHHHNEQVKENNVNDIELNRVKSCEENKNINQHTRNSSVKFVEQCENEKKNQINSITQLNVLTTTTLTKKDSDEKNQLNKPTDCGQKQSNGLKVDPVQQNIKVSLATEQPLTDLKLQVVDSRSNSNSNSNENDNDNEYVQQRKQSQIFGDVSKQIDQSKKENSFSLAPYLIQFAFGIHATLEGLAIGVQQEFGSCLTIALAVLAHKWAEGLVLGLAFKKAQINTKRATLMIALQAIMNPIGIGIGWALSDSGSLANGILMSISAGTFIYIATNEVIVEEFNLSRYKKSKFLLYLIGIGFISALWQLEQVTGE